MGHVGARLHTKSAEVSTLAVLVGSERWLRPNLKCISNCFTEHSNHYGSELIFDLQYGREGTDEPLAVHGGYLQVVEVVRLQVGHHLAVDGILDGHVGGELAVAENEDLGKGERER